MSAVADRLEAHATELAARSIALVWRDPFWDARFGARGLAFATEDGQYHVTWLCESLRASSAEPIRTYARWLQGLLTTRGMCSLHIVEHFTALATVIAELGLDPEGETSPLLAAASAAVVRHAGPAGRIDAAAGDVAREVAPNPREIIVLLSYLADALALERPELFVEHVRFARTLPGSRVDELLMGVVERLPAGRDVVEQALAQP